MSNFMVRLKVISLLVAFVAVLVAMHFIQNGALLNPLQALGLFGGSQKGLQGVLNLCSTRVKALEFPGGPRIFQQGRTWHIEDDATYRVDSIAMEKWLARHCVVQTQPTVSPAGTDFAPLLTLELIDGRKQKIEGAGRFFRVGSQVFVSEDLESALGELRDVRSH